MSKLTTQIANITKILNAPNLTYVEILASSPSIGSVVYNVDDKVLEVYDGTQWLLLLGTRQGGGVSGGALYEFSAATFTSGGAAYRNGPSLNQARTGLTGTGVDAWKSNTEYFSTETGVQLWTVPKDGTYSIDAYGAEGANGGGASDGSSGPGGLGARVKGDFSLTKGAIINLVVGQVGWTQTNGWGGGTGGGGSFAWLSTSTAEPLIAAGGGGGGGFGDASSSGGQSGTSGGAGGRSGGAGGSNKSPGAGSCGGGGGNGWNGGSSSHCGGGFTWQPIHSNGAVGFTSGGHDSSGGGFGGGGGSYGGSGGGGGYSGGGSGGWSYAGRGGGGGSYNSGTNQTITAATRTGSGQIIITLIS